MIKREKPGVERGEGETGRRGGRETMKRKRNDRRHVGRKKREIKEEEERQGRGEDEGM